MVDGDKLSEASRSVVCGVCGLTRVGGEGGSGVMIVRDGGVTGKGWVVGGIMGVADRFCFISLSIRLSIGWPT
uniref:Uncharacterized protein n=1 Tax=Methylophaga nitratireducenticrescens TaxID=754476 RepID=I1XN02_METNJ